MSAVRIEMNDDAAIAIIAVAVAVFLSIAVWADKRGSQCKCQQPVERVAVPSTADPPSP